MNTLLEKEELTLALHNLMLEKVIQSDKVQDVLKMLCQTYAFDAGVVYDLNRHDFFIQQEHYVKNTFTICKQFTLNDLSKSFYKQLAHEIITPINKSDENSEDESKLLQLFNASSLIALSIVDTSYCIYGILFLIRFDNIMQDKLVQEVIFHLSLLSKHLSIRTFDNKHSYSKSALENILDNTGIDIYAIDFYTHDILYVNKSMAKPYGGLESFKNKKCWEVLFPEHGGICEFCPQKHLLDDLGNPSNVYSWDYQRAFDGSWFRVFSAAFPWGDGRLAHVVSSVDITENKQNEELIQYMADYDPLTNLPNRRKLVDDCEFRISSKQSASGFVLFFDIDKFKLINDNYGHESGDDFLIQLGDFFSKIPMLKDSIYRNGGDEFVALIDGDVKQTQISNLARFILHRFEKPWKLKKGDIFCNVSIGVSCYPQDGSCAEVLINKADQAMYKVKEVGGGDVCFASELYKGKFY